MVPIFKMQLKCKFSPNWFQINAKISMAKFWPSKGLFEFLETQAKCAAPHNHGNFETYSSCGYGTCPY